MNLLLRTQLHLTSMTSCCRFGSRVQILSLGKTNGFVNRMTSCSASNSPNLARKAAWRLCTLSLYCTRLITHLAERDWRVGKFVNVPASSCPTNNCNFILKAEISSHKLVNSFSFPCRLTFSIFRWEVMSTKTSGRYPLITHNAFALHWKIINFGQEQVDAFFQLPETRKYFSFRQPSYVTMEQQFSILFL